MQIMTNVASLPQEFDPIVDALYDMEPYHDGREAITEMWESGYSQAKQTEWAGFRMEYLFEQHPVLQTYTTNVNRYGNSTFDLYLDGVGDMDLKTRTLFNKSGKKNVVAYLNDLEATDLSLARYGETYIIGIDGISNFDLDGSFRDWRQGIFGVSSYSQRNRARGVPSRPMKIDYTIDTINILRFTPDDIGTFVKPMSQGRNSNGRPRRMKYGLYYNSLPELYTV